MGKRALPKMCHHRGRGLAYVRLGGRTYYLGAWGSAEAKAAYLDVVGRWESGGRSALVEGESLVGEMCVRFLRYAGGYYVDGDGGETSEVGLFRLAVGEVCRAHRYLPVSEFGPLRLKAVRAAMVSRGLARTTVNGYIGRIRRIFKWAVGEEICAETVYRALMSVGGLRAGRTEAREPLAVEAARESDVLAVAEHVSRQVWAMIWLQWLTGMRAGEVVLMRGVDVDRVGSVWVYVPRKHKTTYRGGVRRVYLGPAAQAVLRPFLFRAGGEYLFSPRDAEEDRLRLRNERRKTPAGRGNEIGTNRARRPRRKPGVRYTTGSYGKALKRACGDVSDEGFRAFTTHQLRHAASERFEREFGYETARVLLGHRSVNTTKLYAAGDEGRAVKAAGLVG